MSTPTVWVPRKRRGAEFFLTILAVTIGVMSYCAVGLGTQGRIPAGALGLAVGLVSLAVAAHFVIRRVAPYADPVLLPLVLCLNGLGLAMIYRLDLGRQQIDPERQGFAGPQLVWTILGLAAFSLVLVVVRDHRRLQSFTYTFGFAALALLVMPLMPFIGAAHYGARIWINLGPFSFQPGEAAKICLAIFFAGYLVVKRDALALAGGWLASTFHGGVTSVPSWSAGSSASASWCFSATSVRPCCSSDCSS
jgi:hypothetical protein